MGMSAFRSPFRMRRAAETASVLQHDRDLRDAVARPEQAAAERASLARVITVARGKWDARTEAEQTRGGYGFLVLSGLLVRQIGLGERISAELLGSGDLLRPLEHDGEEATLPFEAGWRALEPMRLALLDRPWSLRMSPFPDVGIALVARAMLRSRRLANMFVIACHPHLEDRLRLLLWELADRYGTVRPDGIHVPIPMTHEVLSELAVARRPSVSAALSRLASAGSVERVDDGWLLHGDPPGLLDSPLDPARSPSG
jgi:CRP/FNR family cyclic AMP-dependent transcriptional regulator